VAQRVGRRIAVHFHDRGTRRWVSGQQRAPTALYPQERPGTHCTGGWVDPKAGLENLVPTGIRSRTVQPGSSVAIQTELPGPPFMTIYLGILLRMRNVCDSKYRETETHFLCSIILFPENRAFYEIMRYNMVQTGRS